MGKSLGGQIFLGIEEGDHGVGFDSWQRVAKRANGNSKRERSGAGFEPRLPRPRQMSGRIFALCKEAVYIPVLGSRLSPG